MKAVAYCRVSTDTEEQLNSLENQKGFFLDYIENKPNLVYAGMYVDEGISGTSTEKRKGFNQMMKDADQGLFDLILIKDISRFARNIVDCLSNIRKLTALGIGVECISGNKMNTLKVDELTLTFQSFIAQQESVNTSERVKLGQRRQMEKGVAFGGDVLGYKKKKGILSIDEKEADTVRLIFRKYCDEGKGLHVISKELEDEGIKTKKGNTKWTNGAVSRVLKNEKYAGDLIQRKTYTKDALTHKKIRNNGEEEFIIHENHHEPIIDRETFNKAQMHLSKRGEAVKDKARYSNRYPFSGKVKCAYCNNSFVSRPRPDRRTQLAWKCYNGFKYGGIKEDAQGETVGCDNVSIKDDLLQQVFLNVVRDVVKDKEIIINEVEKTILKVISEVTKDSDSDITINKEIEKLKCRKKEFRDLYFDERISKEDLQEENADADAKIEKLKARLEGSEKKQFLIERQHTIINQIKSTIRKIVSAEMFSGEVCKEILDKIVVHSRSKFDVYLKGMKDSVFFCDLGNILYTKYQLTEL